MKKKGLVLLAIVSVLIFVLAGCAPAAPPPVEKPPVEKPPVEKPPVEKPPVEKPPVEKIVWKHAEYYDPSPDNLATFHVKYFFDEVEKRSEGRFECKHFWSASLCPAKEQPDGLKSGLFQATCTIPAYYPSKFPLLNIGFYPCLYPLCGEDDAASWRIYFNITNEWHETPALKEEFAKWDALPVCEIHSVFYDIMGNVHITNLEDVKGKRISIVGAMADLLRTFGAAPVSLTAPEKYDALSKGIVDAVAHSSIHYYNRKMYEVSKYWNYGITLGQCEDVLMVSKDAYEALPDDIKEIFEEAARCADEATLSRFEVVRGKAIKAFKEAGIEFVEFSAEDNEKIKTAAVDVWKGKVDKLEKEGHPGREAFNSLQAIFEKYIPGYKPYYL